jgi:hypothetical protein
VSDSLKTDSRSLEAAGSAAEQRAEGRWTVLSLLLLAAVFVGGTWTFSRFVQRPAPAAAGPVDHGPLPDAVKAALLAKVAPHLDGVELIELRTGAIREFRIKGRPKYDLAQDFHKAFRPLVATELRPLLQPYGEILSFEIKALDLPPLRLRALPND